MVKCLNIGKNIGKPIYRSISKNNQHYCSTLLVKSNPTWSGINTAPVIATVSCKNTDIVARSPLTPIDSGASVEWWDPLNMAATLVTFQHVMGRLPIYVYVYMGSNLKGARIPIKGSVVVPHKYAWFKGR